MATRSRALPGPAHDMSNELGKTASHTAIYAVGNISQRLVGLLMLPVYTRYLAPADYGVVSMLQIVVDLVSLFFGMQIATGVFRLYYKEPDPAERNRVLSTALGFVFIAKGIGALALTLAAAPVSLLFFDDLQYAPYVRLYALVVLTESLTFIPFQYVRLQERPYLFVSLSLVKLSLQLSLNILFIVYFGMGLSGAVYASVLSGVIFGPGMTIWLLTRVGAHFEKHRAKELLGYSWPLIIQGFIAIYINASGRIALTQLHGLAEVGLLSLGNQFANVIRSLIWSPFNQVWGPQRFRLAGQDNAGTTFHQIFRLLSVILLMAGAAIAVFSPEVIALMSDANFHGAAVVIPYLVLAEILRCMTMYVATPLLVQGRTVEVMYSSIISAVALTALLFVLVPEYGLQGVAVAGVASAVASNWWVSKRARIPPYSGLPWFAFWVAVGMAGLVAIIADMGVRAEGSVFLRSAYKVLSLLLLLALLVASPLVGREMRTRLVLFLRSAVTRLVNRGAGSR